MLRNIHKTGWVATSCTGKDPPKGLPLTSSRLQDIFPKLTPAQISRVSAHGHMRALPPGEVLYEQGDIAVPFFVVVSGELEIMRRRRR